jgi:hemerythrin-like domain-containing protein
VHLARRAEHEQGKEIAVKPTEDLIAEHEAVLDALRLLEKVEGALATGKTEAAEHLEQLLDFFKGFVDRCHHGKEEEVLFPELEKRGFPRESGPVGVMLAEHDAGRQCIRGMSEGLARLRAGERDALSTIRQNAGGYRELLRSHIAKENNVLFPLADRLLPEDVSAQVLERFEEIERERVGEGKHEQYHALLQRLKDLYRVE